MLAENTTPFAALGYEQLHRDGEAMATVVVRGAFTFAADGTLDLAEDQALVLADEYDGRPDETPLLRPSDLIPFKPAADVTVLAEAQAPAGQQAASSWLVGLRVDGRHAHFLRVFGPRAWNPQGNDRWVLGEAEPVTRVPLDYRLAAGGVLVGDRAREADPRNPIGAGIVHAEYTPRDAPVPAPRIEAEHEPVTDPFVAPQPQGFGPVAPAWAWRHGHAGTYDDAWLRERHPLLPADFDYRFHQTAHPALILPGHLRGDEQVELGRLVPGQEELAFALPGVVPYAVFEWEGGASVAVRLNCDGLHLDLRQGPPWRLDLTWRAWVVRGEGFFKIALHALHISDPALPSLRANGLHGLLPDTAP